MGVSRRDKLIRRANQQKPVQSAFEKYSAYPVGQISATTPRVSPDKRDGSRSSRTRGRMRWTRMLRAGRKLRGPRATAPFLHVSSFDFSGFVLGETRDALARPGPVPVALPLGSRTGKDGKARCLVYRLGQNRRLHQAFKALMVWDEPSRDRRRACCRRKSLAMYRRRGSDIRLSPRASMSIRAAEIPLHTLGKLRRPFSFARSACSQSGTN